MIQKRGQIVMTIRHDQEQTIQLLSDCDGLKTDGLTEDP